MPHSKKKKKKRQFYSQSDPTNLQKHTVNMFFLKKKKNPTMETFVVLDNS